MKEFEVMKSVYCYFLPEVRRLLHEVNLRVPDELFFVSSNAHDLQIKLQALFDPELKIPADAQGNVDLDQIHVPIIGRIFAAYKDVIPCLNGFTHHYPTSGSSDGIFHLLVKLKMQGVKSLYVLNGEYEGYEIQAKNLGMEVNIVDADKTDVSSLSKGCWFISNPSARDGNIIENNFIKLLCDFGHKVVIDFAYVGSTKPHKFDVSHKNIIACVMSFSKPYGVFRFRIGGFVFSRDEIPTLYGSKWFKDVVRLLQALKIAEAIGPQKLYNKYATIQRKIVRELNHQFSINLRASDSFLLAHLSEEDVRSLNQSQLALIAQFKRGSNYRFCLTKYFERNEVNK